MPGCWSGSAGLDELWRERLRLDPRLRLRERQLAHIRHLNLVLEAVRRLARAHAGEVDDLLPFATEAVVEHEPVAAPDDELRPAVGRCRRGKPSGSSPFGAFSMNDFRSGPRKLPPVTGSPWNSVSIGFNVVG